MHGAAAHHFTAFNTCYSTTSDRNRQMTTWYCCTRPIRHTFGPDSTDPYVTRISNLGNKLSCIMHGILLFFPHPH